MSYMFCYCCSLLSLPDINKWNINKNADSSSMFFACSELASRPNTPKINIQTKSGKIINIFCQMSDTILVIKEKIQELEKIPAAKQKLFYEGRELEDSLTLRDYNIEEMKTILLSDN